MGLLVGCAHLPDATGMTRPRSPEALQARASLDGPVADWPTEQWWRAYGDPQLDGLVQEALVGSPDLAMAAARLERAEAALTMAGAARKPQVRLDAEALETKFSYHDLTPAYMTPQGWNDRGRVALDFRWELDFWGRNRAALAAATSERAAKEAEWAQARLILTAEVTAGYAEWGRLWAHRDTAAQAVAIRRTTAALLAERYTHGLETRGGLREGDARLATAEGALLAVEERIELQRHRLAALLGAGPDRGLAITRPDLKLEPGYGLPADLGLNLLGRRPDIVAARLRAEAAASRIRQRRAAFYPDLSLTAFLGVQSLGLDNLTRPGADLGGAGPALSLPIFSGGRLRGQLRGAQADHREAVAAYDAALVHALQDVADRAASLKALGPRLDRAREAAAAAAEAHRVALDRYRGGLANHLEVLSAEEGLLASLDLRTDLGALALVHHVGLQSALGGGYRTLSR
jgi:NodT family efflux transporter outer membrane factor (OMF) lipoprotein